MTEVVSDQSESRANTFNVPSMGVAEEKPAKSLSFDKFKSDLNGANVEGQKWESTQVETLVKVMKVFYTYIHEELEKEETQAMVGWLYAQTATDATASDLKQSVDDKQIDEKKVLRHLVVFAFADPKKRKFTTEHEKLKNLKTVAVKMLNDAKVSADTDIKTVCFEDGVEAYRTRSSAGKSAADDREANLRKAKDSYERANSFITIKRDDWKNLVVDDSKALSINKKSKHALLVADFDENGNINVRGLIFDKDAYTNVNSSSLINQSVIKMYDLKKKTTLQMLKDGDVDIESYM